MPARAVSAGGASWYAVALAQIFGTMVMAPGRKQRTQPARPPRRVFLVGPMGAGKTTIGQNLARRLKLEFVDSDREIEARTGASIPLIFELEGEEGFRRRESAAIDELTQRDGIVLATGGGAVLRPENRACLSQRGCVIYLYATVDQLLERTAKDRNRPLLQTDDPRQKIEELIGVRDPLYREVADIVLETGNSTIRRVVNNLVRRLGRRSARAQRQMEGALQQ